jgi:flagellar hook-associated protein 1 FlgK
MSLASSLATALSGLKANQAAIAITSSNIANAQTPGYVTESANQVEVSTGGTGASVNVTGVNRTLDQFVQSQLRTETSGGAFADQTANILNQLQTVFGPPGGDGSLENAFSNFTTAIQGLSTNAGTPSAQSSALNAAQSLAQQLNSTTQGIQTLRSNVEQDIGISVNQVNSALNQIAQINTKLGGLSPTDPTAATFEDQRDNAINQLSQLLDVRVATNSSNQVSVFTSNGIELVGAQASQFIFNSPGPLNANSPGGALSVKLPDGSSVDLIGTNSIKSGQIGADLTLRDQTLVQAQTQVDQLAASISSAVSNQTTAGTPVTVAAAAPVGPKAGFNLDLSNVLPGNSINLTYTDKATNTQHQVTIVRVDDPAALPLSNANSGPNNQVIGVNFSGGLSSIVSQLNTALGSANLQFSNPSGNPSSLTLQVVDNGTGSTTVNAASVTTTTSSLTSGNPQLPLFTDGNSLFTGAITAAGPQQSGFAGRITVNPALVSDPSKLSVFNTSPVTPAGDTTRSDFIFSQLTSGTFTYSPKTGLGSPATPFSGTLTNFLQQFLSFQGNAATSATQLQQGQDVVVNSLQQKLQTTAGVNIDTELSNLIALQNNYAANARVLSTVQNLITTLLQVQI